MFYTHSLWSLDVVDNVVMMCAVNRAEIQLLLLLLGKTAMYNLFACISACLMKRTRSKSQREG